MSEITVYIIVGLVLSGTIGMLLGLAITINCGTIAKCIATPIIALIVGFGIAAIFIAEVKSDKAK